MKLVKYGEYFLVLDKANRPVKLSKSIRIPSDIFTAEWGRINVHDKVAGAVALTPEASSFKQLKHYVATYLLDHADSDGIPPRYVRHYEINYKNRQGQ